MKKLTTTALLVLVAALLVVVGAPTAQATTSVPTNVGVPAGTTLTTHSGDLTVTTANSVVDSLDITGKLIINAANVTVIRTKVETTAHTGNGIEILSGASANLINDTVTGFSNSVVGGNYQAVRLDISGMNDDGFKVGDNTSLIGNYCHGVYVNEGAHSDCAQLQAGETDVVIADNYFDMTNGNSALIIAPDLGPSAYGPITVRGNFFNGGNWTVQAVNGAAGAYHNYRTSFIDNRWGNTHTYGYENIAEVFFYDYATNVRDDTGAGV